MTIDIDFGTEVSRSSRKIEDFAYAGSVGDTLNIDLPTGFSTWLGQTSYRLRKITGKNVRIYRNRTRTGYDHGYTAFIEPKECDNTDIKPTEEEKSMTKVSDKLTKVNESYTINMYDNGYMVEVGGRDSEDEWKTSKIICNTLDEVIDIVRQVNEMPRND